MTIPVRIRRDGYRHRFWICAAMGCLLWACGKPFWNTPPKPPEPEFPVPKAEEVREISIRNSRCMGACPAYIACLRLDAPSSLVAVAHSPLIGRYQTAVDSTVLRHIVGRLLEERFFGWPRVLGDSYLIDVPITTLSARVGNSWKHVSWAYVDAPELDEFLRLTHVVDSVAARQEWHYVGPVADDQGELECTAPSP